MKDQVGRKIFFIFLFLLIVLLVYKNFSSRPEILSVSTPAPLLINASGTYAVVVKNFKTGESYTQNEHYVFQPASLYKLWVMGAVFAQKANGQLKHDDYLSAKITDLNQKFNIPPESAELTDGEVFFTVDQAVEQMITISHNYAAFLLTDKIGPEAISNFLKNNGFNESAVSSNDSPPKTTAHDIALFFEKLYQKELISPAASLEMLEILKRQKLNGVLPKYLPAGAVVAHKTAKLDFYSHDAGLVFSPRGDYLIVVASETPDPLIAEEIMSKFSQTIFFSIPGK